VRFRLGKLLFSENAEALSLSNHEDQAKKRLVLKTEQAADHGFPPPSRAQISPARWRKILKKYTASPGCLCLMRYHLTIGPPSGERGPLRSRGRFERLKAGIVAFFLLSLVIGVLIAAIVLGSILAVVIMAVVLLVTAA